MSERSPQIEVRLRPGHRGFHRIHPPATRDFDGPYSRGGVYAAKGDYDRAIADYTEAIRIFPHYPFLYWDRADAYEQKGDIVRAAANHRWGSAIFDFPGRISGDSQSPEIRDDGPPDPLGRTVVQVISEDVPFFSYW